MEKENKSAVTWLDFERPSKADIDAIKKIHDFHPIILDELLHFSTRSRVEQYDSYLYLVYHFPIYDVKTRTSRRAEVDFLITKDTVITIRYEPLEPIEYMRHAIAETPVLKKKYLSSGAMFMYSFLQAVHEFCLRELRHVDQKVTAITKDLFSHQEYQMLQRISYIKRDILDYGVITKPQALILHSLRDVGGKFWGEEARIYLSDLASDHLKITEQLENYRDTIESCEETNAQLLNAKTNAVMQRFTILAFLTFPLMLFTSLFSIEFVSREITNPRIFWFGFGAVLLITSVVIYIFKRRGLLRD
ncbi:MAG: CorA family divalent cation transporter [bacterium]|nr:CorA family divalent cation transporter [bacterium]